MEFVTSTNQESQTCVHEACVCKVTNPVGSDGFCSEFCSAAMENEEDTVCACGHPQCDSPE